VLVLDTHAWIWWVNESAQLSVEAQAAITNTREAGETVGIPAIVCWEVAMLVQKQRLVLAMDVVKWLDVALQFRNVQLIPLSPSIAALSTRLEGLHGDPADRLIVATSLIHESPLVTKDQKITAWGGINTVW
jgi:PIN domain nuclease of toxin-antitoxin system